ncbi:MAG: hypothetical protein ACP5IL_14475 [Syntrophobacteraceae bacterium]
MIDPRGLEGFGFGFSPGDFNPAVQYTPQTNDASSLGDDFASYMDANGQHVINYMSSNDVQSGLRQFAWGAAGSPQELLFIDDSAWNGLGGVFNNYPGTNGSAIGIISIIMSVSMDKATQNSSCSSK